MADQPSVWEQQNLLDVLAGLEQAQPATASPPQPRKRTRPAQPDQPPAALVQEATRPEEPTAEPEEDTIPAAAADPGNTSPGADTPTPARAPLHGASEALAEAEAATDAAAASDTAADAAPTDPAAPQAPSPAAHPSAAGPSAEATATAQEEAGPAPAQIPAATDAGSLPAADGAVDAIPPAPAASPAPSPAVAALSAEVIATSQEEAIPGAPQLPAANDPGAAPAAAAAPAPSPALIDPAAESAPEAPMPSLQPLPSPSPSASAPGPAATVAQAPAVLLVLDTETTSLSPADGVCIEVGAVLFHVASRTVLSQLSFLLPCRSNPARAVNGIAPEVTRLPQPLPEALQLFRAMAAQAEAVLAHNTAFDRQWFGLEPLPPLTQPWICSMEDIRWPEELHLRANPSVRDLALAHGVPVWAAHRALTDCTYLVQVLERCRDLEALLQAALEPRHLYRARLGYAERHLAKEAGFRWNQPVSGAWSRRLSEREAAALPFPVERLDGDSPDHREALRLSA